MHVATRIVADWLEDGTNGVNAIAATVPLLSGDSAPASLTLYEETADQWLARRRVPDAADATASIAFPMICVVLNGLDFEGHRGKRFDGAGVIAEGTARVLVQVYNRDADTANNVRDAMYWQRAIRGSLMLLDNAADSSRTQLSTKLFPSNAISQPPVPPELGDLVLLCSTLVTYPVWETTPLTA